MDAIAQLRLTGVRGPGEHFPVVVEIGRPYLSGQNPESWSCPISVEPLYSELADQMGIDSLHALLLACRLAFTLLSGFISEGGRLVYPDGTDFDVTSYSGLPPFPMSGDTHA